jgi:hypothetical protein
MVSVANRYTDTSRNSLRKEQRMHAQQCNKVARLRFCDKPEFTDLKGK